MIGSFKKLILCIFGYYNPRIQTRQVHESFLQKHYKKKFHKCTNSEYQASYQGGGA